MMLTKFAILLGYILLVQTVAFSAEIKSVKAVQGKESDYFNYEDYDIRNGKQVPVGELQFLPGCSWYCGGYVNRITATSKRAPDRKTTFKAANAHDFSMDTAWIPQKGEYGIGHSLTYEFNFDREEGYDGRLGVTTVLLASGYRKTRKLWEAYSRPKKLRMFVNDTPYRDLLLLDSFEIQTIDIGKIMFPPHKNTKIKFVILEVYPGKKCRDVAISELVFEGVGVH